MKNKFLYTVILIAFLHTTIYGQGVYKSNADKYNNDGDTLISNFLHINDQFSKWPEWKIVGFVLQSVDTANTIKWESELISPLDKDEKGYLIKANIPSKVRKLYPKIWCSLVYTDSLKSADTLMHNYGGIRPGGITLKLQSSPKGAQTFLVSNRTWISKIKSANGTIDYKTVEENYRVSGGNTEIEALVDETVFVVVYKLNGKYKYVVHYTKPESLQKVQTVFLDLER